MSPIVIIVLILLLVLIGGGVYWFMIREPEPEPAPAPAPAPAPEPEPALTPEEQALQEDMEVIRPHPLKGKKFLISKKLVPGVIVPKFSTDDVPTTFDIVTSGVRKEDMMVEFIPITDQSNTYYLYSPTMERYIKYSSSGFGYRGTTPTTEQYKIKFTSIGENYVMSYMTTSGVEMFFGIVDGTMKSSETVTDISGSGLVNVEDGEVGAYVLPGNFGNEYSQYGTSEVENIRDCLGEIGTIDDTSDGEFLSVAYKNPGETEESPCRAYKFGDDYSYDPSAEGWVTTCVDKTKDISQGCLL
jgi:hypothetical protein